VSGVAFVDRRRSGRAGVLVLSTPGGDVRVDARDIRAVLRPARSAMLPSTYVSVQREERRDGRLVRVVLDGHGNGHGVGLCQWGAIGRARAGQDVRTILQHYYPGAIVSFAD
jgi:stage II sporulation protein D